jgi:apolipoprotein N-acyltransferase
LIGSPSVTVKKGDVQYYNSAYLINKHGNIVDKYDKVHLVPFGEYVPFKKYISFIGKMVEQVGDFQSGQKGSTIQWKNGKLGLQICYEIIFPDLSRAMVNNGANLLVNITNDAWFGTTSASYQHFAMAVFRAVENKRILARSANTGISGFVDPTGRILATTPLYEEKVLTRSVPILKETTVYTRYGDIFALTCLALTIIYVIGEFIHTWTQKITHRKNS